MEQRSTGGHRLTRLSVGGGCSRASVGRGNSCFSMDGNNCAIGDDAPALESSRQCAPGQEDVLVVLERWSCRHRKYREFRLPLLRWDI